MIEQFFLMYCKFFCQKESFTYFRILGIDLQASKSVLLFLCHGRQKEKNSKLFSEGTGFYMLSASVMKGLSGKIDRDLGNGSFKV